MADSTMKVGPVATQPATTPRSFELLVQKYGAAVRTLVLMRGPDLSRSDDISQQVFLTAWQRLPELGGDSDLWPWLEQIVRNHLRNEWRKALRERRFKQRLTSSWVAKQSGRVSSEAEASTLRDRVDRLRRCLELLPENLRKIAQMRYQQANTSDVIASALGKTAEGIRQLLVRLRLRLKDCVQSGLDRKVQP